MEQDKYESGSAHLLIVILTVIILVATVSYAFLLNQNSTKSINNADSVKVSSVSSENDIPNIDQTILNPVDNQKIDVSKGKYYSVVSGDREYFGRVAKINDDFVRMEPTVYRVSSSSSLIFAGDEIHGPSPGTYFKISNLTQFQELTGEEILNIIKRKDSGGQNISKGSDINSYIESDRYQAFFFRDGSNYYAKVSDIKANFLVDSKFVFTLRAYQATQPNSTSQILLLSESGEYENLSDADLLYWQNMKSDSRISKLIAGYEQRN